MSYLDAAVAVLTVLTLLNILLVVGILRRLREHTERFARMSEAALPDNPVLAPGRGVGAFSAVTTEGETVSSEFLDGETLIGFFSPTCKPCKAMLPKFADYARTVPGGRGRVLAVVLDDADPAEYVAALSPVARVVIEAHDGALTTAFDVAGFPALCLVGGDGTVVASGMRIGDLPAARTHAAHG